MISLFTSYSAIHFVKKLWLCCEFSYFSWWYFDSVGSICRKEELCFLRDQLNEICWREVSGVDEVEAWLLEYDWKWIEISDDWETKVFFMFRGQFLQPREPIEVIGARVEERTRFLYRQGRGRSFIKNNNNSK